ncbi:3-methyl-2-oxobutanoate hydroxymethyltransferase [Leeuwenhoekiella marinoflava]|uniref:Lumazine-binding protein n=2 Tax=Leeuwenhoekiella marinoflava TaxID=988 RepID=A0A4Q0PS56_9FLAO|nr:3-methyl-2-oxobutanoate hydroxymethyltransferase [Leeuwenhoekiella marinoflava]RXG32765.1 hypothetical protein DSL99_544 [Leeuwenhoekiella marinoflava]SHE56160.1 hypothetical protein SAMN02745246_00603 [Leeuwenhoekiella marinoflava DSM 3653]
MKRIVVLLVLMSMNYLHAQEDTYPEETVVAFFNAFHQQDTLALKELVYDTIKMQSVQAKPDGTVKISTSGFNAFLKSIASIPQGVNFEERILDYQVRLDGLMANVWTPYEFYINGEMSHCGVNSFQLIWVDKHWKVFYIVDTRKSESCE